MTINEARVALGREPLNEAAANRPMVLTGAGYAPLEQGAEPVGKRARRFAKDNPYHDERGRFTTADGVGTESSNRVGSVQPRTNDGSSDSSRELAFSGMLIDKRYDEVANITHCTYSTPLGTFTLEAKGYLACLDTYPAPRF